MTNMKKEDLIIGEWYHAIGNCGMTKDIEVYGRYVGFKFGSVILESDRQLHSCNPNTVR